MTARGYAAITCLALFTLLAAPPADAADARYRIGPEDVLLR